MAGKANRSYSLVTIVLVTCIMVLLLVIGVLLQKLGYTGPPDAPPPPAFSPLPPPPPGERKSVAGTVMGYDHNGHLDINGIKVDVPGRGLLTFEFRPHTASAVCAVAKQGAQVQVGYRTMPNDEAIVYQLASITNTNAGEKVDVEQLPPPPRIPPGQQAGIFNIVNPEVITDSYGGIDALRIPGKIFHFKPEQVESIQAIIKNGHTFALLAVKRDDDQGFVNINKDETYIVINITIDDKTYMIR